MQLEKVTFIGLEKVILVELERDHYDALESLGDLAVQGAIMPHGTIRRLGRLGGLYVFAL